MAEDTNFSNRELPIVTVFGAGIAGLTAAHELIERGFTVQVVEPTPHPTSEYECAVGGLAANQFSRVRSPLEALHPWLTTNNKLNWGRALAFRDWNKTIEPSAIRFPLKQKLRFDRQAHRPETVESLVNGDLDLTLRSAREPGEPAPADWKKYWDAHGVLNKEKIDEIFRTIRRASRHNMRLYFPALATELDKYPNFKPDPTINQAPGAPVTPNEWRYYCRVHEPNEIAAQQGDAAASASADQNARNFVARETFFVRIIAYTDDDSTQEENRKLACYWAEAVRQALIEKNRDLATRGQAANLRMAAAEGKPATTYPEDATVFLEQPIWELERRLEIVVRGSVGAVPSDDPRTRSLANRVEFEVVEQMIPGEHGFRFFPGFYRHIFDTMRRTPVINDKGIAQGTAFDQLIQTPHPQLSLKGALYDFDSRNITTMAQARRAMDLMTHKLGFKSTDLLGLSVKTFRFLTSGRNRRENQTENITMIDYIGGDNPNRLYTPACLDFIDRQPRALAAMSASESDARSQYSILLQLGLKSLPDPATLNGPTSLSWLDPWKAYLKKQGVKFFVGRLTGMTALEKSKWEGETATRLVPVVQGPWRGWDAQGKPLAPYADPLPENPDDVYRRPGAAPNPGFQHRFVLATQFQEASDIVWKARDLVLGLGGCFEGPFAQLVEFDIAAGRRLPGDAQARPPARDPITGKEPPKWPTRTISGAQFFFPQSYRFGISNVYFADTPYLLTSISQYAYWRQHRGPVGQLLGQISVDIADWHSPYPKADANQKRGPGHRAFYSSAREVAQGTWEQVLNGLDPAYASVIQAPRYYHLDQNMVFHETQQSTEPPGWIFTGGVRANATLHVPENTNPDASLALVAGRSYWAELRVGQTGEPIRTRTIAYQPDDGAPLRDALFADLWDRAGDRLLLEKANGGDIIVSPVASLAIATLRVLKATPGRPQTPFRLVVEGRDIIVPAGDPAAVIERFIAQLAALAGDIVKVERPAPDYLTLTPLKGETLKVGVLNADRRIELVGAPSLIVKTLNLQVREPVEGFALIRNDYQYIIDIPGQWRHRPGLCREPGGLPGDFVKLSTAFGVRRPEIYYAHPETCPLLEKWVGAGAHMATYTRMTTMEAANESGRHAAAALIYKLHSDAIRDRELHYQALAGDFPAIYPVEDNEGEEFEIFTKLDDILYDMGQPHLFEVIGLSQLVDSIQAKDFNHTQIIAKLAPLLAGLPAMPGLRFAAPEFGAKLAALIAQIVAALASQR